MTAAPESRIEALFTASEAWNEDPLKPTLATPTPASVVAELTAKERERRVAHLVKQSEQIVDEALALHLGGKELVAECVLFSGGNDSTVLAHMMRPRATHAIHANTTVGIEETRQFVRDTCQEWQLPLLERTAPISYRELVLERGFPGPAMHYKMFQRLKERALDQVRRELVPTPRRQRILFIAGRRRLESDRRADIPLHERRGSVIWASPLANWSKLDMNTYRLMCRNADDSVPVNRVSDLIHMSGECLCGSFAKPGELDEIGMWFPEVKAEIEALERDVAAAGFDGPLAKWGNGVGERSASGSLCSSCSVQAEPIPGMDAA